MTLIFALIFAPDFRSRDVMVLDYDSAAARQFGRLRAEMLRQGQTSHEVDLMIAAVALSAGLILVTHNTRHFNYVPGLQIEDWLTP